MRYRIYFRHDDTGEESVREVEADGLAYRICDDHGRVVFGEPCPKRDPFIDPLKVAREPNPILGFLPTHVQLSEGYEFHFKRWQNRYYLMKVIPMREEG